MEDFCAKGQTDKLPAHLACEDGCTFVVELDGYLDGSGTQGQTILLALFKPVREDGYTSYITAHILKQSADLG